MEHTILTLLPAFGREYKSKKAVLADWENGKAFFVSRYTYPNFKPVTYKVSGWVSKEDVETFIKVGIHILQFRYCKKKRCTLFRIQSDIKSKEAKL